MGLLPDTSVCSHLGFSLPNPHEAAVSLGPSQPWGSLLLGSPFLRGLLGKLLGLATCLSPSEPAWASGGAPVIVGATEERGHEACVTG